MFKKNSAFETKFIHKLFIWTIFQSCSKTLLSNKNVTVMPLDDVKKCEIVFWHMNNIVQQIENKFIQKQYMDNISIDLENHNFSSSTL